MELGGEERNKANPINKTGGGGETSRLKNNNQLMMVEVSGASGCGGQWRGGKRRQWEREKTMREGEEHDNHVSSTKPVGI